MTIASSSRAQRTAHAEPVDTRAPGGPEGRLYLAAFADVWDHVLDEVRARGRWDLVHHDEELGLITVHCRGILSTGASLITIWVSLDENGLTRVDLRSVPESRRDLGSGQRRVRDLLDSLDRALGPGARVTP
jgi:hypothetical protein